MKKPSWIVSESDVAGYSPANHNGTVNRRLISRETVGARHVEVVLGTIEQNQGALPHAHPGIEQICYLLSGSAIVEVERSEEHTSELQSLMRISYAVFCLKKKNEYNLNI